MNKKLIVIDGGNILHKAIFSYRNNPQMPAYYTYIRMIIGYLKKVGATIDDTVIIAEDYGSWRKKEDKTYKAQRKGFRESLEDSQWWKNRYEEFNNFIPKLNETLPYTWIKIFDCESDDIASAAVRFLDNYDEKILISSDKDWEQLCQIDKVKIFSPISKKYKVVKNPMKVLLEKIAGDRSDNLIGKPTNEEEYELRKRIVNLLELPDFIESKIKKELINLPVKNLYINRVPFKSVREQIKKLYKI